MVTTTSGNPAASTAIGGRGGDGNGRFTLKAKLALGVALLGCAGALAFGGLRATSEAPTQAATGAAPASGTHRVWAGTCRAGGSDCLPGDDDTAPGVARTMPRAWTGTCRAGGSDCLPDEDFLVGAPAAPGGAHAIWAGPCRAGSSECLPDEDILAAVPAAGGVALDGGCVAASTAGVPGEGCATALPTAGAGPQEFLAGEAMAVTANAAAQQPVDASTSAQFRWVFGPESGVVAPDLAMLPPSLQHPSA